MALALVKNQKTGLALTKPVSSVSVKLNWEANGIDLDLVIIGKKDGRQVEEDDVLYWGTVAKTADGKAHIGNQSVVFVTGDNRTGQGDDDEVMIINTQQNQYSELEIYTYIYPPNENSVQTLDEVSNGKLEIFLDKNTDPSHYFNFSDDKYFGVKGILAGILDVRVPGQPKFEGKDIEFPEGLIDIFRKYGFA